MPSCIANLRAKDLIDERLAQIEKCGPHAEIQRALHTKHGQSTKSRGLTITPSHL